MAKKKRKGNRRKQPSPVDMPSLPDPRVMEHFMKQLPLGPQSETDQNTPLAKAHEILLHAYQEPNEQRRIQLARKALTICPDCADAYVLLAEHAESRKDALELYEKGVAAGERALGPAGFQRGVGHFWGILETRPYMRSRLGLAHSLWVAGRREEAVVHLQDMLRLNPNDNQGLRYTLAGFLLSLDRDKDLANLLQQYPDEASAAWSYTKALLRFRQDGDTPDARQLLKEAAKRNKHVPAYLLGDKSPSARESGYYSPGDESEAREYIGSFMAGWKATPGAFAWLRQNVKKKAAKSERPAPKGPLGFIKKWLNDRLPQEYDVWQADCRQLPQWLDEDGEKFQPWLVLLASRSNQMVMAHDITRTEPSAAFLWDTLVQAMQDPVSGEPHRPSEIQVRSDERWESLRPHIEQIGIELVVSEELDQLDDILNQMKEEVVGKAEPGLLDMPGVKPEQVGSYYDAAAFFYQQAPWKKVGYESAIKVECDKFQSGPWYGVLMGQSGLTMGLAVYDDLATLQRLWADDHANEEIARQTVGISVLFGEPYEIPVTDYEASKKMGWKVARPDAYPLIFHKERGMSLRLPLAWELELMEGCLRAVPDFVNRHKQNDPAREVIVVPVASGQLRLSLSWVVDS